jgi:hypothetical protein
MCPDALGPQHLRGRRTRTAGRFQIMTGCTANTDNLERAAMAEHLLARLVALTHLSDVALCSEPQEILR